jgi:ribonuclease R
MDTQQQIQRLLAAPNYHPLRRAEIAAKLKLNDAQRREFRRVLAGMVERGEVARVRQDRFVLPQEADLVAGRIEFAEKGFAFVIRDTPDVADVYVAEPDTGTAMHGDKVLVRLQRERRMPAGSKPAGRVIRILERAHDTVVGTLQKTKQFHYIVPDDPRFAHNVYTKPAHGAQVGDKVVVQLAEWTSRHVNPEGVIIERLGKSDAPGVDILSIIRKYQLPTKFSDPTVAEVDRIPLTIPVAGRLDLRDQFIITIDPDDAKDFDDAINVDELPDGGWRLGVHIADVSHYVTPGSALDREARSRGNSVYLVDRVVPMLPEKLSNGLCSLRPREDRLTQSCIIEFTAKLTVRKVEFHQSVIHSKHRLTYKEAFARLQSKDGDALTTELHKMWRLADKMRRQRFDHGALDLDFPEMKVRLDPNGRPTHIEKVVNDISHQLVEEFMLAANEAVARHLCQSQIPCVYRIHEKPDPEKLGEFRDYAKTFGLKAGDLVHREQLQQLLESVADRPEKYAIHMRLLRSLKQARYAEQPVGHYGLSKKFYTHFTSPIRRYADLVVHRTLAGKHVYPLAELAKIAEYISQTERTATEAERESVELKKLEYFQDQLETGKRDTLNAVVSGVRNFGFFVELTDSLVSGLVHVSSLADDFYHYDPDRERLVGKTTKRVIQVGDRLRVQVERVDLFKRQIDFHIVK